jgi:catechol 2,3-dioxygenase-like lactoylglutathione lyase family enzyme
MTTTEFEYVTTRGEAAGKLLRFSHLVFITRDMDETVKFYRDILGLPVVSTRLVEVAVDGERQCVREYFFEIPGSDAFGFYEVPESPDGRTTTPLTGWFWPGTEEEVVERPHKLDHMCFHVETKEDVDFFCSRLTEHGIPFLGPFVARATGFTHRIYFYDPSGNPLELATVTEGHLELLAADSTHYLGDDDPVPSMLARPTTEEGQDDTAE